MSALELRSVSKSYGRVTAVQNVDLEVPAGCRTAIVGPSGSGKTTLLRLIAGFEAPDTGSIHVNGSLYADGEKIVPAHKRQIGYLPQDGALFPHMSVADNVGFGLARDLPGRGQRIAELMELVALDRKLLERWPHELSGGQQQRVALARAMAQRPHLMLLDEPFSALDTGLRAVTRKAVAKLLAEAGVTTVLVTHDQAEALSFADQVAVMKDGRLVQVGSPREVYLHPKDRATAEFLGDAIILPARIANGWATCDLGRFKIDDLTYSGIAQIMIRPEQLQLVDDGPSDPSSEMCLGLVADVDFGGSTCMLTIQPAGRTAVIAEHPVGAILVRCPSVQIPEIGATIRLKIVGAAHLLKDSPPR